MQQRAPRDEQPNEPGWWHWWFASDGKWYPPESLPRCAPPPPVAKRVETGFAGAALALAVITTLAGFIPVILFIGWAMAPHVSPTP
jgi:uncharacterized membrane protein YqaE (UPF0057 family)